MIADGKFPTLFCGAGRLWRAVECAGLRVSALATHSSTGWVDGGTAHHEPISVLLLSTTLIPHQMQGWRAPALPAWPLMQLAPVRGCSGNRGALRGAAACAHFSCGRQRPTTVLVFLSILTYYGYVVGPFDRVAKGRLDIGKRAGANEREVRLWSCD